MSVTVFLANKGFTLPITELDERRREAYFKNPADTKNKLLPEEDKILKALGINLENAQCLMPHLANFFKHLPKCQSDSSLVLAKECETVQFVLWETLFAARSRSQDMYDENWKTKKPLADISAAINKQIINDLKPKPESLNDVDRLFKLIMKASVPGKEVTPVDKLFTLIVPSKMGENPQPLAPSPPGSGVFVGPTAPPADKSETPIPPSGTKGTDGSASGAFGAKGTAGNAGTAKVAAAGPADSGSAITAPSVVSSVSSWTGTARPGSTIGARTPEEQAAITARLAPHNDEVRADIARRAAEEAAAAAAPPPGGWTGTARPGSTIGARTPEEQAAITARLAPHNAEVRADIARRAAEAAAAAAAPPPGGWTGTARPGSTIGARTPEEQAAITARLAPHNDEVRADIARRAAEAAAAAAKAAEPPPPHDPLSVLPTIEEISTQCAKKKVKAKGKDGLPLKESYVDQFIRSLYFFYCIKYQQKLKLSTKFDKPEILDRLKRFLQEWQTALTADRDGTFAFLGLNPTEKERLNKIYIAYQNAGVGPNPALVYDCNKLVEQAAGRLNRFIPYILMSEKQRIYNSEFSMWSGRFTDPDANAPRNLNDVGVLIYTEAENRRYIEGGVPVVLNIVTTADIQYDNSYVIGGKYMNELTLIKDLVTNNYVLNIHPWLMYLFNKARNDKEPIGDGSKKRSIEEWFLRNLFGNNYIPPKDPRTTFRRFKNVFKNGITSVIREQLNVAYYVICNAIATADQYYIPNTFYSKSNEIKSSFILGWLRDPATNYRLVEDAMEWVAPNNEPLTREKLIAFFEAARRQTRKNGNRNNADRTLTWASNLRDVMTRVPGSPPPAPPPPPPPPTSWTGIAQPGTRIGARTPEEQAAITARLAPHNAEVREDIARRAADEAAAAVKAAEAAAAAAAAARAAAASRGRNTLRREVRRLGEPTRTQRLANIRRRAAELQREEELADMARTRQWTGTDQPGTKRLGARTPEERAAIRARLNARNTATRRAAASRGRNALRRGLHTRRLENIRRRAAEEQALLPPDGVWTGALTSPPPRNETEAERAVRESVAAREASKRGRNKLRRGLKTRRIENIRRRAQEIKAEEEAARARIIEKAQRNLNALRASSRKVEKPNDGRLVLQEPRPGRRNTQHAESSNNLDYYNSNAAAAVAATTTAAAAAPPLPRRGWRNWARGRTLEQAANAKAERARLREEAAIEARLKKQLDEIKAKAGPINERLVAVRIETLRLQEYITERERDIKEKQEEIRQKKAEGATAAAAYTAAKGTRDEAAKRRAAADIVRTLRSKESTLQTLQKYVQEARSKIEKRQAEQTKLEADNRERIRKAQADSEAAVEEARQLHARIARMYQQSPDPALQASLNAELAELNAL